MMRKPNYCKGIIIAHGKSELLLAEHIKSNLHLPIEIYSLKNGKTSIQIDSLMTILGNNDFKNKSKLKQKYILKKDISNQELYYDYSIAYKIYNYLIEIYSGINDEMNEMNELYKDERMQKNEEIRILKLKDEELFSKDIQEYDVIYNSSIYKKYMQLQKENEDIKKQNNELLKQLNEKNNVGFFDRILNKISTKKLHK